MGLLTDERKELLFPGKRQQQVHESD